MTPAGPQITDFRRAGWWLPALLAALATPSMALAEAATEEVPPLQCGWRTDRVAVRVGEPLTVTLTCAAAETDTASVMPDWDELQPDAVDLAPFEVLSGVRGADTQVASWRYSQFEYRLRLTGEEFFGLDVPLPPLEIPFSIAVGPRGGMVQMGRERRYVLPALPLKVLSLVPGPARDIEEVANYSFAAIERRQARASLLTLVGGGLLAAGGLCLLLFLASLWRALRAGRVRPAFQVPDWRIVMGCREALRRLASEAHREGWSESALDKAMPLLRTLGAVALGEHARQRVVERRDLPAQGEWLLRRWSIRRPFVAVSAAITPARLRAPDPHVEPLADRQTREAIADALDPCAVILYGRESADARTEAVTAVAPAIDSALAHSRGLAVRIAWLAMWRALRRRRESPPGAAALARAFS